jgi:hypothetical protein
MRVDPFIEEDIQFITAGNNGGMTLWRLEVA